jgi:hypothetical protein
MALGYSMASYQPASKSSETMASDPATNDELSAPLCPRWLASWKHWLLMLFVALALIAAAICIPTYQRMHEV